MQRYKIVCGGVFLGFVWVVFFVYHAFHPFPACVGVPSQLNINLQGNINQHYEALMYLLYIELGSLDLNIITEFGRRNSLSVFGLDI